MFKRKIASEDEDVKTKISRGEEEKEEGVWDMRTMSVRQQGHLEKAQMMMLEVPFTL